MAFLNPLPIAPRSTAKSATATTPLLHRPRRMEPKATIAAPATPPPEKPAEDTSSAPWMPLPGIVHEVRTPEQYDRLSDVASSNNALLVVDFMAAWCRKCKYLLPKFRKLSKAVPEIYYCSVDVNKVRRLPKQFDITKMPTFVFVRNGQRVHTLVGGAAPEKVGAQVEAAVRKYSEE